GLKHEGTYPNPFTGTTSCPMGFTASKVLGTPAEDYNVFICSRPLAEGETRIADFGGMYGENSYVNPYTSANSCPTGFDSVQILGTAGVDRAAYFCYRAAQADKLSPYA